MLGGAAGAKPPPVRAAIPGVPLVKQETDNGCTEASTAAVLGFHGRHVGFWDVKRSVRAFRDGTTFFHVAPYVETTFGKGPNGLATLTFRADEDALQRLIAARLPTVVRVTSSHGLHALVLIGYDRGRGEARVIDPANGTAQTLPRAELAQRRAEADDLVFLIFPRQRLDRLGALGLPLQRIEAQDRRYRAMGTELLAAEHTGETRQRCDLLAQAEAIDPSYRRVVEALVRCLEAMNDDDALAASRAAKRRLDAMGPGQDPFTP